MIPPDVTSPDPLAYAARVVDALGRALENSSVEYVVALSSIGADKSDGTGPVLGLHEMEKRLQRISGLNTLLLRAGYFMENTLAQIGAIRSRGITAGPLRADLKLPMIATQDIGAAAAKALLTPDFKGCQVRELLGQRDLTMTEAARVIGKAIGSPSLTYTQLADRDMRPMLLAMGFFPAMAGLLLEMSAGLNSGHMRALEQRSPRNTTPTSYEAFVAEELAPRYKGEAAA